MECWCRIGNTCTWVNLVVLVMLQQDNEYFGSCHVPIYILEYFRYCGNVKFIRFSLCLFWEKFGLICRTNIVLHENMSYRNEREIRINIPSIEIHFQNFVRISTTINITFTFWENHFVLLILLRRYFVVMLNFQLKINVCIERTDWVGYFTIFIKLSIWKLFSLIIENMLREIKERESRSLWTKSHDH